MADGIPYGVRLAEVAAQEGDATAIVLARSDGTDVVVSWRELDTRTNQVARLLASHGIGQDDTIVIAYPSSLEHVFTTFGAWKLGASALPLRAELPAWERDRLLAIADAALVAADWDDIPEVLTSSDVAASTTLDASPLDHVGTPRTTRMIATSGSTGTPKIIAGESPGIFADSVDASRFVAADVHRARQLVTSPLYHTNGFSFCAPMLLQANQVVLMERFDAALAVDLVERHRITHVVLVPTMLQRIARLDDIRARDLSSIERVVYGGATLPEWVARTWLALIPPERFVFAYGGTEGIGAATCDGTEWLAHPGTTGRPSGCELLILDAEHRPLPTGEVGEIFLRLPGAAQPFHYVGGETPDPIMGGFRTFGDMGYVDGDGYLYVVDRRQDMIVTGGANVFPAEVEAALSEHPGIVDVVVVGVADPEWGHRVHAIVQLARRPDAAEAPSIDDLRTFSKARLASYKVPKTFELVDAVPRTAAGKVNRTRLAEERAPTA